MKKTVITAFIFFLSLNANSQVVVNETNVNELDIEYVELIGTTKILNPFKIKVFVDYGQKMSWKQQTIKNVEGKNYAFNTMIEALNFMDKNGWEYVNNYLIEVNGALTYRYLLKRKTVVK